MMGGIDVFGIGAAVTMNAALLPQLVQIYTTRDAAGVSMLMYILYSVGLVLWVLYGIGRTDWILVAAKLVGVVLSMAILVGIVVYS